MIIRGIFTNTKLSPERMNSETTVPYIVANECPGLKRGDLVQLVGYDSKFQVVWTYASSREQESYEPIHKTLPKEAVTHYIGDECGEDLATSFIYRECAEKWDIYHIHVEHGGYYGVERVSNSWKPYVGDNLIISDKEHVGESIARIVSNSYGQQTNS